jgi:predicted dehydrogenase
VRLGVVGAGLIAQLAHLPALRELDDRFAVAGLAEPDPRVRELVSRRHGVPAFADHEALLERGLDAVLVCSPNGTHARVVLDALAAGLHVLVEKPLCLDPADAEAIVARAGTRVVQVGYMKRFDPGFERLLEHRPAGLRLATSATVDPGIGVRLRPAGLLSGAAPDDAAAQVASALGTDDPRHVVPFSEVCLGALVHDVNLLLAACPGPWRLTDATAGGDAAFGAWRADDGARWTAAWLRVPEAGAFREELALYGDGVARLTFPAPYLGTAPATLEVDGEPARRWRTPANAYRRSLEHFHACVTAGAPCRTPAAEGARDVALLTELYRAAIA